MSLVTKGLPNGGLTRFYAIDYDDTLDSVHGRDVAQALMTAADADYQQLITWFRGAVQMPTQRLPVHVDTSAQGAQWWGWGPLYSIYLGFGDNVTGEDLLIRARYMLLSEVSEIFMRQRQFVPNHWFAASDEGNKGEALSCFLANELLVRLGAPAMPARFNKVGQWLSSTRANFLNLNNDHIVDPNGSTFVENGCNTLFLAFLHHQMGISIEEIIAHGSDTLEGVFANLGLGPRSAAYPTFVGLVNSHYVQDGRLSANPILDNIFPVPELAALIGTPKVTWANFGVPPVLTVRLDRPAPMDVLVTLSSSRPDLLSLPPDAIVRAGQFLVTVPMTLHRDAGVAEPVPVTVTASYAGTSLAQEVVVSDPVHFPWAPLRVQPVPPSDPCGTILVEGTAQAFSVGPMPDFLDRRGLLTSWSVQGASGAARTDGRFHIDALPAAGTRVRVTARVHHWSGYDNTGVLEFDVLPARSELAADAALILCRVRHIVDLAQRLPRIPIPEVEAPDDLWKDGVLEEILTQASQLQSHATALTRLTKKVSAARARAD